MSFRFAIDRGGTFTDIYAETPKGPRVLKLLSVDPKYDDAPREGIRRILEEVTGESFPASEPVRSAQIEWIRMGTTVATNALLERNGARCCLVVTKGFADVLRIGDQSRPGIFDLSMQRPTQLYERVVELDERVRVLDANATTSLSSDGADPLERFFPNRESELRPSSTGQMLQILQKPDVDALRASLAEIYASGVRSVAVVLLHSYAFAEHERLVEQVAKEIGFTQICLSSHVAPMVRCVPRGLTTCADAYLSPLINDYIRGFSSGFDADFDKNVKVSFMMSDGGLCPVDQFHGYRSVLSGPAGGVVGYAMTTYSEETRQAVIGFDMGGTSTDVSRYDGHYEHVFDAKIAGVTIQAPQLDINTVAAGGGSRLFFQSGLFVVGPESSGAHPGPICYRKNGFLSVTDANLFLGRLLVDHFPHIFGPNENLPLDREASAKAFEELTAEVNSYYAEHCETGQEPNRMTAEEVAMGFLRVANESMSRPIRSLTEAKGYDASKHVLACFGGAGGQHACDIARALGMRTVFIHRYSGILSAFGLKLARLVAERQEPFALVYSTDNASVFEDHLDRLQGETIVELQRQGFTENHIRSERYLNLRYDGTDTAIMTLKKDGASFTESFETEFKREFGFVMKDRAVVVDDVRVRSYGLASNVDQPKLDKQDGTPEPAGTTRMYFEAPGWCDVPFYQLKSLGADAKVVGPTIIIDNTSTIVVPPECVATITTDGDVRIDVSSGKSLSIGPELDLIQLSVFSHRFMSVAEQMGRTLQRTASSTNIRERLDFSCALFGPDGGLVANAPHLPVHLGAMQEAVRFQIKHLGSDWREGEVIVSNHPHAGGSHLPDITVITPVYSDTEDGERRAVFYVASRGHHADIGGISPGSMPPFSSTLDEEGAHIISFKLVRDGVFQEEGITELLMAPGKIPPKPHRSPSSGTRALRDNLSDLRAQVAANQKGITLMGELIAEYGLAVVLAYMHHVQDNAEEAVRDMLVQISLKHGLAEVDTLRATDFMDDGTPLSLALTIDRSKRTAHFDFGGTGPESAGNCNAPRAVTFSAIIYSLRCLVDRDIPLNQGCMAPITVDIPEHTILSPSGNSAVVGGNVLTSQRATDVVLTSFQAAANSQGCMNNFTFGNDTFGYYETIAGGGGAGPTFVGESAVHSHMTNTKITDAEILERRYPVLLKEFSVRRGSGGDGLHRGGDGVVRDLVFLQPLSVGILSERRSLAPNGLNGGGCGQRGLNLLYRRERPLSAPVSVGGKNTVMVDGGDRFVIHTPGGGGYGVPSK